MAKIERKIEELTDKLTKALARDDKYTPVTYPSHDASMLFPHFASTDLGFKFPELPAPGMAPTQPPHLPDFSKLPAVSAERLGVPPIIT